MDKNGVRWFVWTIVFLVVAGIGLTTYIIVVTSNDDSQVSGELITPYHQQKVTGQDKMQPTTTPVKK